MTKLKVLSFRSTSKRLLPGTLVVFTNDNFNTMKFGTVFDRSLERLEKTYDLQVDVQFQLEDAEFVLSEGYIMVIYLILNVYH